MSDDKKRRVRIVSDGTPHGTEVTVDGKPIDCKSIAIKARAGDGLITATLVVYIDEIDVIAGDSKFVAADDRRGR